MVRKFLTGFANWLANPLAFIAVGACAVADLGHFDDCFQARRYVGAVRVVVDTRECRFTSLAGGAGHSAFQSKI
jgi:hypothetical protein